MDEAFLSAAMIQMGQDGVVSIKVSSFLFTKCLVKKPN